MNKEFKILNKEKGLTMIELVISLFVLVVAVIGVYNAFSIMVVTTNQMSDRFTAAYLAQEGIEVVRNIRDNNWLAESQNQNPETPIPWNCGLVGDNANCNFNIDCSSGCQGDYKTGTLSGTILDSYANTALNIDANGFYSYSSCPVSNPNCQTKFKRKITIDPITNSEGEVYILKVVVEVSWEEKPTMLNPAGQPGSITAEDYLYNWY
ncbi:MAG: prepilin-type N-terminal cleavage/methylation domain-containing protein [Patescibacteria group bacterium]